MQIMSKFHLLSNSSNILVNINLKYFLNRNITNSVFSRFKSNKISENIVKPEIFQFTNYDCVGFDLDNTICRYKVGAMMKMEYEVLSTYMVKEKGYPSTHLLRPLEDDEDFMLKGLILDLLNGNLLRIAANGRIIQASHGTKHMSETEIIEVYGKSGHWNVTDQFCKNPLVTWNGPLSSQIRTLLDYFDIPAGLVFARIVDTLDEIEGRRQKYNIWPDLLAGLVDMYERSHFQLNKGGYFPKLKANPELYINKCEDNLIQWLKDLKAQNKILFLITGSHIDFASFTACHTMGINWKEQFNMVIFFAKKPGFFTEKRPFLSFNNYKENVQVLANNLKMGEFYSQGNWKDLNALFSKITKKANPRIVYVGDNIIQDIFAPAFYTQCDTVAIVEELQAEGIYGFEPCHWDQTILTSKSWGSFFYYNKIDSTNSIWQDIIHQYSKLCIPSMEFIASHPIDHKYKCY